MVLLYAQKRGDREEIKLIRIFFFDFHTRTTYEDLIKEIKKQLSCTEFAYFSELPLLLTPSGPRVSVLKVGVHWVHLKAVFTPLKIGQMEISCSHFKQYKNPPFITQINDLGCFMNFWVIIRYIWKEIIFLEGLVKLKEIRNVEGLVKF